METEKINNFWLFFKTIGSKILNDPEDLELINCLDKEVRKLGEVSWEYGPIDEEFYFSLSPNFKFDLIPYTDFAISIAPSLKGWKFISGKPQKLDRVEEFVFFDNSGSEININTKNWRAVMYKFKDNTYDIDLIIDTTFDEETNYLAINLAMVNLLGEINYIRKVENIKIVKKFDSNANQKGIKFTDLVNVII